MDFNKQKPIYLQIADTLSQRIMADEWAEDERIPSVREVAGSLGVNPNTVMRTFDYLQQNEIIYNRRGVGYFVAPKAKSHVVELHRQYFVKEELPYFFQKMDMLGLTMDDLSALRQK
ncbi:MAG: GntR family transcriptional regulator [Bacteroidales bacterium]|nr:GntR family transcriptional regulator [Candidatus Colimorpha merdihippi]MCQ2282148.1 GntR family transcriptional regulator [Bacteroidales bacterium]